MTCQTCLDLGSDVWTMSQGDLSPRLSGHLENADGTRPDLTGATVLFLMENPAGVTVINAAVVVDVPLTAQWHYQWVNPNTTIRGSFRGRIRVVYPSGNPEMFPSGGGFFLIHIG